MALMLHYVSLCSLIMKAYRVGGVAKHCDLDDLRAFSRPGLTAPVISVSEWSLI